MIRYLLDTNHAGNILRANSVLPAKMLAVPDARFSLCLPSIGELWHMIYKSSQIVVNQRKLEALLDHFDIYPFDQSAAQEFGRLLTELRRAGQPIPAIDIQIGAIAITNGLTLLTADAHFNHVPRLPHENWL
jgi:tRNA(fMet)-specific endonuclease VapC